MKRCQFWGQEKGIPPLSHPLDMQLGPGLGLMLWDGWNSMPLEDTRKDTFEVLHYTLRMECVVQPAIIVEFSS